MTVLEEIGAERRRQIEVEGWTLAHDDQHTDNEIVDAAVCYAGKAGSAVWKNFIPLFWPWERSWWKPTTRRRDLIKAAALIVAELERIDRRNV